MTNKLKTTLKGTAFALTLFSFIGCSNDDNTATTSTTTPQVTVSVPATTITSTVKAAALPSTSVTADGVNRTITLDGNTSISYRIPVGVEIASGTPTSFYTLPSASKLITGTVDTSQVKIKVGDSDAVVDTGLIKSDLTLPAALALPTGNYEVTLPTVNLGSGDNALAVDSFVIKGVQVADDGTSNFLTGVTASSFPAVGSSVANTSAGFTVDQALSGKTVNLTMKTAAGKTYTQAATVNSAGQVKFAFTSTDTLTAVSSITLELPAL